MKKITKVLLPIASTVAIAAPITCLASCSASKYYEDVVTTNFQASLVGIAATYKAKKEFNAKEVRVWVNSFSFPKGVQTLGGSGILATATSESVNILIYSVEVPEKLEDGSAININLHLTAYDDQDKVLWNEKSVNFKITHNSHVN